MICKKMEEMLKLHLGVLSEDFQHKLIIVAEGQQLLVERLDRFEERVDTRMDALDRSIMRVDVKIDDVEKRLGKKIDSVAADLSAHRAGTEVHRGYKVCEGP